MTFTVLVKKKKNKIGKVNEARYEIFLKNYKVKDINEPFAKKSLKKFDASCLPPCNSELYQQFLRAYFVTKMWMNSDKKELFLINEFPEVEENQYLLPTDFGWSLNENADDYEYKWFDGPQLPATVEDIINQSDGKNNNVIPMILICQKRFALTFRLLFPAETDVDDIDTEDSDEDTDDDI